MTDFLAWVVMAGFVAIAAVWSRRGDGADEDEAGSIGSVRGIHVDVVAESGDPMVMLTLEKDTGDDRYSVRITMEDWQAQHFADMMRLAAAPGANLVQARWNLRRRRPA